MNTKGKIVAFIVIILIATAVVLILQPFSTQMVGPQIGDPTPTLTPTATSTPTPTGMSSTTVAGLIHVTSPKNDAELLSPFTVKGEARGTWYFEASFPVQLKNDKGVVVASGPAQAQGDWMTENFVPFTITLSFKRQVAGSKGTLILHRDNPSGLPQNEGSLEIPVVFK